MWIGPVSAKVAATIFVIVFVTDPPWDPLMPWTLVALIVYLTLSTNLEMLLIWRGESRPLLGAHVAAFLIGAAASVLYAAIRYISLTGHDASTKTNARLPYETMSMGIWVYMTSVLLSLAVAARWYGSSNDTQTSGDNG